VGETTASLKALADDLRAELRRLEEEIERLPADPGGFPEG
jgi:hypothetical protein